MAIALIAESSSALAVAQGEQNQQVQEEAEAEEREQLDITDTADARQFAVDMLGSGFPASEAAAAEALAGDENALAAYKDGGMETAQNQDLRQVLVTLSAIGGPTVQNRVTELLDANDGAGDTEAMAEFINSEWQELQAQDDRATAWEAAEAPRGTALKRAADAALKDNSADALSEFAATGAETARSHDRRREVYDLTTSELPSVAAGAQEAIQTNTDTAIESFLRYGQYVAAAQDAEQMDISELVNMAIEEAGKASEANNLAVQQADRAARAAENARKATIRARDEAIAADAAQGRAANAASQAGKLAEQSARVADQAVAASQEARIALQQTADALSRAAAAAARARAAAGEAAARASAASRDAGVAREARIAAEVARDAAKAAENSQRAYADAADSAAAANRSGGAASSAANNADAAAAAASEAAGAAGVSESAAAEARAGAARARAAAGRARAAANEVDRIVGRINSLVEEARKATDEAIQHARRAADAAEEAAREAGNAEYAARMSGKHAEDAAAAAKAADEHVTLAEKINDAATEVADSRAAAEKDFLRGEAEEARAAQDAQDAATAEATKRRNELTETMNQLGVPQIPDIEEVDTEQGPQNEDDASDTAQAEDFDGDIDTLREATVAAARVGGTSVAGAAQSALSGGTDADLKQFAMSGYPAAVANDETLLIHEWWDSDPNEAVRSDAEDFANAIPSVVHAFVTDWVQDIRKPDLTRKTWQLRETAGPRTIAAADDALRTDTYEALDEFVNGGGYQQARWSDQVQQAYELVETGGPEVKAAAEAAVVGDREGLNEFITVEQFRRAAMDNQRSSHDAQISSMLFVGRRVADLSQEMAANAQAAHERALGSANRAREFADAAAGYAGHAQESARLAGEHLNSAQQSLEFAKSQQVRAHEAAASAEADAAQATANAEQATSHAIDARASANAAASSAASARASADAAGQDAALAAQAADDAYQAAVDKDLAEQTALRQAQEEARIDGGNVEKDEDLVSMLKRVVGSEAIDALLEFLGVNDLRRCFGGSVTGCLMTAANVTGLGKILKLPKLTGAIARLVGKIGDVRSAMRARRSQRTAQIDRVHSRPACGSLRGASFGSDYANFSFAVTENSDSGSPSFQFAQNLSCTVKPRKPNEYRGSSHYRLGGQDFYGNGIQRHHIIAKAVIIRRPDGLPAHINPNNAPCIQMTPADHALTQSYQKSAAADRYRDLQFKYIEEGNMEKLFETEVDFIHTTFDGKYDEALDEMLDYAIEIGLF